MVQPGALVSVIVATYRSGGSLRYALESIKNQSYQKFEVIVVADGDPEDSETIVNQFNDSRLRYLRLRENSGSQALPNRAGIEVARGEWIAYLGHDDLWMPRHLEQLCSAAKATGADFVYSLVCMVRPDGSVDVAGPPDVSETRSIDGWFVPPSGWMHRKNVEARVGGWRMPGPWPVDFDFLHRARRSGVEFACSGNVSVLKFLSAHYGSYRPGAPKPQEHYIARLTDYPAALERELLLAAATGLAQRRFGGRDKALAVLRHLVRTLITSMQHRSHDWPILRFLWTKRHKRGIYRMRKHRGLDSD